MKKVSDFEDTLPVQCRPAVYLQCLLGVNSKYIKTEQGSREDCNNCVFDIMNHYYLHQWGILL